MVQYAAYLPYLLLVGLSARVVWDTRASYGEKVVATFAARMALPVPPGVGSVVLARLVTRARAGAVGGVSAIVVFAVLIEFSATEDVQTMLAWLLPAVVFLGVSARWAVTAISSTLSRPAREVRIARPQTAGLSDFVSPVTRRIFAIAPLSAPTMWAACAALVSLAPTSSDWWTLPVVTQALPVVVAVGIVGFAPEKVAVRAATVPRQVASALQLKWEDALRTDSILIILAMPIILSVGSGTVSLMSTLDSRRWAGEDPAAAILSNGWAGLMIWGLIAICLYVMVAHPQQRFHATLWAAADPVKSGTGAP